MPTSGDIGPGPPVCKGGQADIPIFSDPVCIIFPCVLADVLSPVCPLRQGFGVCSA